MTEPLTSQWFEFLKSPPRILFGVALFCLSAFFAKRWNYLPIDGWEFWVVFVGLLSGSLFASTFLATLRRPMIWAWNTISIWRFKRSHAAQFAKDIPFLHDQEKQIFGWLLTNNKKWFTAAEDGGHAVSLLSKRYVVIDALNRQTISPEDVPMTVPEHIWNVLEKHRSSFPTVRDGDGPHPWRVNWMVR
jgi:hypothetical protein